MIYPQLFNTHYFIAGTNISDELQQIRSLKEKKACFLQDSSKTQENIGKNKDEILEGLNVKVKDRMSKYVSYIFSKFTEL